MLFCLYIFLAILHYQSILLPFYGVHCMKNYEYRSCLVFKWRCPLNMESMSISEGTQEQVVAWQLLRDNIWSERPWQEKRYLPLTNSIVHGSDTGSGVSSLVVSSEGPFMPFKSTILILFLFAFPTPACSLPEMSSPCFLNDACDNLITPPEVKSWDWSDSEHIQGVNEPQESKTLCCAQFVRTAITQIVAEPW